MNVTVFSSLFDKEPVGVMPLMDVLTSTKNCDTISYLRSLPYRSEDYHKVKLSLPCWRLGIWTSSSSAGMVEHGGALVVEWDGVEDTVNLKRNLRTVPFVHYAGLSCGGHGVFAVIPIKDPVKHEQYFVSLVDYFKNGGYPAIDTQCKNLNRARLASYDPYPTYNAKPLTWDYVLPIPAPATPTVLTSCDNVQQSLFFAGLEYINRHQIDITADRSVWLGIGIYIKNTFGEAGEDFFVSVSSYYPKFQENACRKTFRSLQGTAPFGVFANACTSAGIPQLKKLIIK